MQLQYSKKQRLGKSICSFLFTLVNITKTQTRSISSCPVHVLHIYTQQIEKYNEWGEILKPTILTCTSLILVNNHS
ncbi:hypothetical protein RHGRI_002871 [Rhododendron griersonianum]|uniref:Uncharacterized protein n=1 Tax=Rhododendron griersonianum TaxID=479676 RepID=A0AAV6LTL7_9ERIC|nr:hypothetical protein RHGRI_002871 [Rhododendron griersonianum]